MIGPVAGAGAAVLVNGVTASVSGGVYTASVPLDEGNNTITAVATDVGGNVATASVQVILDTTAPTVTVDSPPDGYITAESGITITGLINDLVIGTVNGGEATVQVNGVAALVSNRSYLAADIPLILGDNTIDVTGTDSAGNSAYASVSVFRADLAAGMSLVTEDSGNGQTGPIGGLLSQPLVVKLTDGSGVPVAGQDVIFEVTRNNGTLSNSPSEERRLLVTTDSNGFGQVNWTLGTRSGAGNNVVEATALGFTGKAIFSATAIADVPDKINVDAGNNQTGVSEQALPSPLVAVVTDAGHNRLEGVPVTFTVTLGDGGFDGASSVTVDSDSDGRAVASWTLGPEDGFNNNKVEANFTGNTGLSAVFNASGLVPADPLNTIISGVVLDHTDTPLEGVTVHVEDTTIDVVTDDEGQFFIQSAPVGHVLLEVIGSTIPDSQSWPTLEFELVTVAGRDNTVGIPIYLLPLNPEGLDVDETTGGLLTLDNFPGFSLDIAPNSVTFKEGGKSGRISVTVVHNDKIPMTPNFGQQPGFVVTIQPAGALFDPPAPVTYPNVDGLLPGEVTELYSFDHDLGLFVSIGTGTVSEDGTEIQSDPGVGIIKAGWSAAGPPDDTGSAQNVGVTISGPTTVKVRQELTTTITANGSPSPGTWSWFIAGGNTSAVSIVSHFDSPSSSTVTVRGISEGSTFIGVRFTSESGASQEAAVTVQTIPLVSISIDESPFTMPLGGLTLLGVTGTFEDNSSAPVADLVSWDSSDPDVVHHGFVQTILGLPFMTVSALSEGQSTITVSKAGLSDASTVITVKRVSSLSITPTAETIKVDSTQEFEVIGRAGDGTLIPNVGLYPDASNAAEALVKWKSSDSSVANFTTAVAGSGQFTGKSVGQTNITASVDTVVSNQAVLTVKDLVSISIDTASFLMPLGGLTVIGVNGTFSDGSIELVADLVTWESSRTDVVSLGDITTILGLPSMPVTGLAEGESTITAKKDGLTDSSMFILVRRVATLAISPISAQIEVGGVQVFNITARAADGTEISNMNFYVEPSNITEPLMKWHSSDTSVASSAGAPGGIGQFTGISIGQADITASVGSVVSGTGILEVLIPLAPIPP